MSSTLFPDKKYFKVNGLSFFAGSPYYCLSDSKETIQKWLDSMNQDKAIIKRIYFVPKSASIIYKEELEIES